MPLWRNRWQGSRFKTYRFPVGRNQVPNSGEIVILGEFTYYDGESFGLATRMSPDGSTLAVFSLYDGDETDSDAEDIGGVHIFRIGAPRGVEP